VLGRGRVSVGDSVLRDFGKGSYQWRSKRKDDDEEESYDHDMIIDRID
jgi:hypothetical protein